MNQMHTREHMTGLATMEGSTRGTLLLTPGDAPAADERFATPSPWSALEAGGFGTDVLDADFMSYEEDDDEDFDDDDSFADDDEEFEETEGEQTEGEDEDFLDDEDDDDLDDDAGDDEDDDDDL